MEPAQEEIQDNRPEASAIEDLLAKVKTVAQSQHGELFARIVDEFYDQVTEEYFSPEDLAEIEEGFAQIKRGEYVTLEEYLQRQAAMKYTVSLSKEATKELDRLDRKTEKRIQDRLEELAAAPYSGRLSNELIMSPGRRHSRVGNWRILYQVIDSQKVIDVSAVQHRSRVYKELKK